MTVQSPFYYKLNLLCLGNINRMFCDLGKGRERRAREGIGYELGNVWHLGQGFPSWLWSWHLSMAPCCGSAIVRDVAWPWSSELGRSATGNIPCPAPRWECHDAQFGNCSLREMGEVYYTVFCVVWGEGDERERAGGKSGEPTGKNQAFQCCLGGRSLWPRRMDSGIAEPCNVKHMQKESWLLPPYNYSYPKHEYLWDGGRAQQPQVASSGGRELASILKEMNRPYLCLTVYNGSPFIHSGHNPNLDWSGQANGPLLCPAQVRSWMEPPRCGRACLVSPWYNGLV